MPSFGLGGLLLASFLAQSTLGIILTQPAQLTARTYDFVIVGGTVAFAFLSISRDIYAHNYISQREPPGSLWPIV
jgi:hypothetical protein